MGDADDDDSGHAALAQRQPRTGHRSSIPDREAHRAQAPAERRAEMILDVDEDDAGEPCDDRDRASTLRVIATPFVFAVRVIAWILATAYGMTVGAVVLRTQRAWTSSVLRNMQVRLERARDGLGNHTQHMEHLYRQNLDRAVKEYQLGNVEFAVIHFRAAKLADRQLKQQVAILARLNGIEVAIATQANCMDLAHNMSWVNVGKISRNLTASIDTTDSTLFGIDDVLRQLNESDLVPTAQEGDSRLLEELKALAAAQPQQAVVVAAATTPTTNRS